MTTDVHPVLRDMRANTVRGEIHADNHNTLIILNKMILEMNTHVRKFMAKRSHFLSLHVTNGNFNIQVTIVLNSVLSSHDPPV